MAYAFLDPTDNAFICVQTAWNEVDLLKLIPGSKYDTRMKVWKLPKAWASVVTLRGVFTTNFTYHDSVKEWIWAERTERIDPSLGLRQLTQVPPQPDDDPELFPFQTVGVKWLHIAQSGLLGDELGTGKTVQILEYLQELEYDGLPAIVICPNSVKYHWKRLAEHWFTNAQPFVIEAGTANGRKILAKAQQIPNSFIIVNYESVKSYSRLSAYGSIHLLKCKICDPKYGDDIKESKCQVHPKELNGFKFKAVIIDEAHHISNPKSQQTRATWQICHAKSVLHRWALTGTPDNVEHLWAIMHAVSPDEYPTKSKWIDRYAMQAWNAFGGMDIIGFRPDTKEEAYKILDPRFRRMVKEIVLPQLPPKMRETRFSVMAPSQKKQYDEVNTKLRTVLPDGQMFIAKNKLVSRTRLMQFAAGTISIDDKPDPDDVTTWAISIKKPSHKIETLKEVLGELGDRRFVLSCEHSNMANMAAECLADFGIKHSLIVGGIPSSEQYQATQDLKSGAIQAIVFTIRSGGEGLDMSGADTLIRLQRSWSLVQEIQTENRIHRIGSEVFKKITIIDIVTKDSVEEDQIEKLNRKMQQLEEIVRDRESLLIQKPIDLESRLSQLAVREREVMSDSDLGE